MMQPDTKKFQRWMGSHALVALTLLTDLFGAYVSFAIGQYVFPAYAIVALDLWAIVGGIVSLVTSVVGYVVGSLQGGDVFLTFMGVGAVLGLLLGAMVATSNRYGDAEFGHGLVAFGA